MEVAVDVVVDDASLGVEDVAAVAVVVAVCPLELGPLTIAATIGTLFAALLNRFTGSGVGRNSSKKQNIF